MKLFLISTITLFIFTSGYSQQVDINALKKDPIMIQYKKIFNELKEASIKGTYKLPNDPNLAKEFAANPSKEGMIKVLKSKGMINADDYVNKVFLQNSLMFQFLLKNPGISKLDQAKKIELLGKLLDD